MAQKKPQKKKPPLPAKPKQAVKSKQPKASPTAQADKAQADSAQQLRVSDVLPSKDNAPRDDASIKDMAESIRTNGLISPIVVRPHPDKPGKYELVAGERRWRAHSMLKLSTIAAIVREYSDDQTANVRFIENFERKDLTPLQQADQVAAMLARGRTIADIADMLGKPASWVAKRAQLCYLTPKALSWIQSIEAEGMHIPTANMEIIARLDPAQQDDFVNDSAISEMIGSSSELQRAVTDLYMLDLGKAPWRPNAKIGDIIPCDQCPQRTGANPNLFADVTDDHCTNGDCWQKKMTAHLTAHADKLREKHGEVVLIDHASYREGSPELQKLKANAVPSYKVTPVVKTDSDAVPALVVDGLDAGKVIYVRRPTETTDTARGSGRTKAAETIEDKRAALHKKRLLDYLKTVLVELTVISEEEDHTKIVLIPRHMDIVAMAAVFGAESNHVVAGDFEQYEQLRLAESEDPWRILHASVCRSMRYKVEGMVLRKDPGDFTRDHIDMVSRYLHLDEASCWAHAEMQHPEPKAWAKLAAAASSPVPAEESVPDDQADDDLDGAGEDA